MITIKKLFVGSLPWGVDDQKLGDLFSQFGSVMSAVVLKDRMTGRSRGFGFVEMENDAEAMEAVGIVINRNSVPFDPNPPFYPSGLRIGTPGTTSRGMKEKEM